MYNKRFIIATDFHRLNGFMNNAYLKKGFLCDINSDNCYPLFPRPAIGNMVVHHTSSLHVSIHNC